MHIFGPTLIAWEMRGWRKSLALWTPKTHQRHQWAGVQVVQPPSFNDTTISQGYGYQSHKCSVIVLSDNGLEARPQERGQATPTTAPSCASRTHVIAMSYPQSKC